jgi:peptide/nickel transport system permease protein
MATNVVTAELEVEGLANAGGEEVGGITRRQHFLLLLRKSIVLKIGVLLVFVAVFLAIFGPALAPKPTEDASGLLNQPPGNGHLFGTDSAGLDVFSRVIAAPRVDVTIALVATLVSVVLGTMVGLLASFFRGRAGDLVMRASDTLQAFPLFVLAVVFVVAAGRSYANIVVVIAIFNIPIYLRLIRSEVVSLRERTFVEAARANGDRPTSIAFRHVLPNALSPGFAQMPITFGFAIITIAGLSFIGAGVQPPTAEWGSMINAGRSDLILGQWWTSIFPGIALSLTTFGFAIVGEAVQTVITRK